MELTILSEMYYNIFKKGKYNAYLFDNTHSIEYILRLCWGMKSHQKVHSILMSFFCSIYRFFKPSEKRHWEGIEVVQYKQNKCKSL